MDEQALNIKLEEWAEAYREHVPFPDSLDACFKWLVPKLHYVKLVINVAPSGDVFWNGSAGYEWSISETVTAETPALALCLAIEKLIEGGK